MLAHGQDDGQEARWESISCPMVRGLNALAVSRLTDNPNSAARRNWRARWESNPRLPNFFGCSIAVELRDCPRVRANFERRSRMRFCCRSRQSQMGKWRDRTEALRAGNRTRTAQVFTQDGTPSFISVEDNRSTSAHRNWGDQPDSHRRECSHGA